MLSGAGHCVDFSEGNVVLTTGGEAVALKVDALACARGKVNAGARLVNVVLLPIKWG